MTIFVCVLIWLLCAVGAFFLFNLANRRYSKITNKGIVVDIIVSLLIAPFAFVLSLIMFIITYLEELWDSLSDNRDWKIAKFFNHED